MKKRARPYYLLPVVHFLSQISLVSAGPTEGVQQLTDGLRETIHILLQFLSEIILDLNSFDEYAFAKILIALIIFFVVYTVIRNNDILGAKKPVRIIVTSAITILAIRYMPSNFVEVILLQYSTFAIAITTILPLLIFFFFVHQSEFGDRGRQIAWFIYGVVLFSLMSSRPEVLESTARYVYYGGIFAVVVFILFDKPIHDQFTKTDYKKQWKRHYILRRAENEDKIKKLEKSIEGMDTGHKKRSVEKLIRDYEKQNQELTKKIG